MVERWLARLAMSPYLNDFVLKGGMLLASLGAQRPTADVDALARNMAADEQSVLRRVEDIASISLPDDGVEFDLDSAPSAADPGEVVLCRNPGQNGRPHCDP